MNFRTWKHHEKKELLRRATFLENCFVSSKSHVQTVPLVQTPPLKRCLTLRILSRWKNKTRSKQPSLMIMNFTGSKTRKHENLSSSLKRRSWFLRLWDFTFRRFVALWCGSVEYVILITYHFLKSLNKSQISFRFLQKFKWIK